MAGLALVAPEERISPIQRLDLAEHLIDLVGAALLLRHPHAGLLGRLKASRFYYRRTDAVLLRGIERLEAFVFEQAQLGNVLPVWHRCYVAPPSTTEAP